jgi:hypothetical protein
MIKERKSKGRSFRAGGQPPLGCEPKITRTH